MLFVGVQRRSDHEEKHFGVTFVRWLGFRPNFSVIVQHVGVDVFGGWVEDFEAML